MTVIGRVEYIAGIDGKKLPAEARKVGRAAAKDFGDEFDKGFQSKFDHLMNDIGQSITRQMRDSGRLGGISFIDALERSVQSKLGGIASQLADVFSSPDGVDDFVKSFDDAGVGVNKLKADLSALREAGGLNDAQFADLANRVNKYSAEMDVARARTIETSYAQSQAAGNAVRLNNALDELANKRFAELNRAQMENLQFNRQLDEAFSNHVTSINKQAEDYDRLTLSIERDNDSLELALAKHRDVGNESDKLTKKLDSQSGGWRSLSANTRQWILIIGSIAAASEEIAVLGSAAGAGLTILGSTAISAGIGVGTMIAAFQNLTGELEDLPAEVRDAAAAWQELGDAFDVLQDKIQIAALDQATGAFQTLKATVEALTPAFELVGQSVGNVINAFAGSIAPGTEGFTNLVAIIEKSGPIFETLAQSAIIFGEAFGNVIQLSLPFVEIFVGWLVQIAEQFRSFTINNADQITEWFENGATIMSALGPLIGAVGQALAGLVTPESVARTVEFIEGLTEFIPVLGQILGVIGNLNILNLVVEILNAIGAALTPIMPELQSLATVLGESISFAIQTLAPIVADLFLQLAPLLPIVAQLASALLVMGLEAIVPLAEVIIGQLIPALIPMFEALVPLIPAIVEIATVLGQNLAQAMIALMPIIIPLIDLVVQLLLALQPIIPVILLLIQSALGPLIAIVQVVSGVIGALIAVVVATVKPFVDMAADVLEAAGGIEGMNDIINDSISFFQDWGDEVGAAIEGVIGWIENALGWFSDLFGAAAKAPTPGGGGSGGGGKGMAAGGIASYGARRLIGEAGREAVVPLQRPLAQIDPSVRALAAFAQGKMGSYGGGGAGKQIVFQAGAIVVQAAAADPALVAASVVDHIAADADI